MSTVVIDDVIRCSSEDTQFPVSNLIKNNGKKWLSLKSSNEQSIEVELQLQKALVISFIDIGNFGSHTTTVLVSHSLRSPNEFECLLPAFTFMTVQESKQGVNKTKVEMFTKEDFMNNTKDHCWDRVKIVCCQPYGAGRQFGLSFFHMKTTTQSTIQNCLEQLNKDDNNNQSKLKSFFNMIGESPVRTPNQTKLFKSTPTTPRSSQITETRHSTSIDKTPKRKLTPAARAQFVEEVDCFLEDIKFADMLKDKQVKVSDLRSSLEKQRGEHLFKQQKLLFMQIITEKINFYKQSLICIDKENEKVTCSNIEEEEINSNEKECPNCRIRLPAFIMHIHIKKCTKQKGQNGVTKRKNRNSLCFDLGSSSDDENDNYGNATKNKRTKLSPSATPKRSGSFNSLTKSPRPSDANIISLNSSSDEDCWLTTPVFTDKKQTSCSSTPSSFPSSTKLPSRLSDSDSIYKQTTPPMSTGTAFIFKNSKEEESISLSQKCSVGQEWVSKGNVSFPKLNSTIKTPTSSSTSSRSKTSSANSNWLGKQSGSFSKAKNISCSSDNYLEVQIISDPSTIFENYLSEQLTPSNGIIKTVDNGVKKKTKSKKTLSFNHQGKGKNDITMEIAKNIVRKQLAQSNDWSDPKSGITINNINSKTPSKRLPVVTESTQQCPICFEEIPRYEIGIHASLCDGPTNKDKATGYVSNSNADLAECPICSVFMPKDIINVHVNHCLDLKS